MRDASQAAHGRIIESSFRPHPWLKSPHAQTLWPSLLRPLPALAIELQTLELPDGDFVRLGWCGAPDASRVAVLVHGLTGGFDSKYLRGLARLLIARQWRVVILELRGGGELPNRSAHSYHHGDTGDLRYLWRWLQQQAPQRRMATVGWSLGANVLLKALGEEAEQAPLSAAAAACAPFLLEPCAEYLRRGFAQVYQRHLMQGLHALVRRKQAAVRLPAAVDAPAALRARDFFAFDDAYTAPLHGFADARDYYTRCQCQPYLRAIRTPTLIINARDDPFMPPSVLPQAGQLAPTVSLELAQGGGHVGFVGRRPGGGLDYWLEQRLADWLQQAVPT